MKFLRIDNMNFNVPVFFSFKMGFFTVLVLYYN
jgi:hypothetical protein